MHFVTALEHGKIHCKEYSNKLSTEDASMQPMENEETDSDVDDWYDKQCNQLAPQTIHVSEEYFVICRYEGEFFPGPVTIVYPENKGARIKVFEKCAGKWRWPKCIDEVDYLQKDIIQHIQFPQPVNNRGTYRIVELEGMWGTD